MQEFQLEGFKPVFSGVNFVTSCHCFVSTGFIIHQAYPDLDKRMFVAIMIFMAMLIFDDLYTYESGDFDHHVHLNQDYSPGSISKRQVLSELWDCERALHIGQRYCFSGK